MRASNSRDVLAGAVLVGIGGYTTAYTLTSLNMGTMTRMGPGMFPAALGVILIGFGIITLVSAFARGGDFPKVNWRPLGAIMLAILAFGLMIRPFGIVPSVMVMTVAASAADRRLTLLGTLALAAILAALAALIFPIGLDLLIPIVAWPW